VYGSPMRIPLLVVALAAFVAPLMAQEPKPVPKDSMRVSIPGCAKGYAFTAVARSIEEVQTAGVPEGTHFRMNGPRKTMADIKANEGQVIEVTGLVRREDLRPSGVRIGGVTVGPGPSSRGGLSSTPLGGQIALDVESWRIVQGRCPSR
jgi:hypothetical protein